MFTVSLSSQDQRDLARNLTTFLSQYKYISDSYIIEFFTEDLWEKLPARWREVLCGLSFPQIADLLLDTKCQEKRYPAVWPLSLLAFRATAHALSFPRRAGQGGAVDTVEEFLKNHSQSSMLSHIFRKHVKPKKQHEIRKLGSLVKQLCNQTNCETVVDVGSGQGHLTRFLAFGLGLSVTAIEADQKLVAMATKFDEELLWTLEKEKSRDGSSQLSKSSPTPHHVVGWVNPKESWELFLKQLREAECTAAAAATPSPLGCASRKRRRNSTEQDSPQAPLATGPEPSAPSVPPAAAGPPPPCATNSSFGRRPDGRPSGESARPSDETLVLTGLHACGDLSTTLLRHFVGCPRVCGITSVACCYMKLTTREHPSPPGLVAAPLAPAPPGSPDRPRLVAGGSDGDGCGSGEFGYPMSWWVRGLPGHTLSYKAREGACHAIEDYMQRLREESALLRTHCYRAALETIIREARPEMRRVGVQTIKKAHLLPFTEYARLGLARVGLPPSLPLEACRLEAMLEQEGRVVVYFSLALLLAPAVETLVLLDRIIYLQENGVRSKLVPLFDPELSPRNFVLVAMKTDG